MSETTKALKAQRIAWLDVESTGISPREGDVLLQIAGIVTDGDLQEIGEGYEAKIYYTAEEVQALRARAVPFVQAMHDATGLWDSLPREGKPAEQVDEEFLAFLKARGVEERAARLGGNSISLDRDFMATFLPASLKHLHYRNYDMTSVGGFLELYRPDIPQFDKSAKTHDAMDDIRMSIEEARWYRRHLEALEAPLSVFSE